MFCRGLSLSIVKELIRSQVQVLLLMFFFVVKHCTVAFQTWSGSSHPTENDRFTQCFFSPVGTLESTKC
ncbi:hypothetical protein HanRHA438_Chr09g0402251 [Helianthus annuus]|uniref:Uncharacterized protein n=1 Tax=Helianthus annuus TaxID=4232 RepID=A0A9K3I751_HELAN|nr:hypothetical protein HanXRQr2_Chr09g0390671 [Helianthus annuus]KAJ0888460.1 hypothetical protein HanRHA438_Chr09g0402251 [Helianthus annuus]KAJ0893347.1 hypothetical protein HanPSC8_Chr09g0376581 [Helianthus annuus]